MSKAASSDSTVFMRVPRPQVRFPFLDEWRRYSREKFRRDLIAGATLTLVSIPQAIGFALILGVPPTPVIISMVVGGFVSALFFSSHFHVFGPTTSISIITATTIAANLGLGLSPLQLAAYLAFLIGTIQFLGGMFNFAEVTRFISRSVVVGYTTAIGILLITSQLSNFMGLRSTAGESFAMIVSRLAESVAVWEVNGWSALIGLVTLLLLIGIKRYRPAWPEALVVLAFTGLVVRVVVEFRPDLKVPFALVKDQGVLSAVLPHFSRLPSAHEQLLGFQVLVNSAIAIAVIGMLEATAITKSLAARSGQRFQPNQELLGMGAGNIAAGLFGVVPGSSSFTRSAVNYQSGAASQFASMISSGAVLLVLLFVTPVFNYIPVAALAAHLMRTGYQLINRLQIRVSVRSTRSDAVVFFVTLMAAVFLKLDTAIYVGIGVSLVLFLQKTSTPLLAEYTFTDAGHLAELSAPAARQNPQISIIHVEGELFFAAADLFQDQVRRLAADENIRVFILRLKNARHLDASTVMAIDSFLDYLDETKRHLLISGCSQDVLRVLRNSGLAGRLGEENIFPSESNPTMATKRALQRAKDLLPAKAEVRIFYDHKQDESSGPPPI